MKTKKKIHPMMEQKLFRLFKRFYHTVKKEMKWSISVNLNKKVIDHATGYQPVKSHHTKVESK